MARVKSQARKATAGMAPPKRLAAKGPKSSTAIGFKKARKQVAPRGAAGPLNRSTQHAAKKYRRRPGVKALQ